VIHRDIKPGNILLDEEGNFYLADFGIAKDIAQPSEALTVADAVVGSLDYLSPEQARSEPVTPRTDIYSLGVVLYEALTGEHPFKDASSVERLYKHINDPLPYIENALDPSILEAVNAVIHKATAKNPEHRYPDAIALAAAFREAAGLNSGGISGSVVEQLTQREQEVLQLIVDGSSNRDIANLLYVTVSTVKWHIRQIYTKLGVRSRVQAIVRARQLNLISSGDTSNFQLPDTPTIISLPEPENPYKGLHAFQAADTRDFFGREALTQKLIARMKEVNHFGRFLTVVGPSGSGKSSVVKAGLIPALWRGELPGSERWFVVDMIPGAHPLDELETALIRMAANQVSNLNEQLKRDERGLLRVANIILPQDDTELVIVIDQFEEVFTLLEDEAARQHFLNMLLTTVTDSRSRVRIIITLRADYYDRPLHYPDFGEMVRQRMETVLPLGAKDLERAVRGPADRSGVTFEAGLVEQIVSEMTYQSGALPLLQYALTELFDRREGRLLTHAAYQAIGGAVGALANRADEIFQSLTDEAQSLSHQIFLRLVTLGEGAEDTRRRVPQAELLSLTNDTDLMEETIDTFAAYRLLSLDSDPTTRQPTVEVAHEAILREWEQLRVWLNNSREDIRQERLLAHAAEQWDTHEQDRSYLLRGARLDQVEKWAAVTDLTLTPLEKDYVADSIDNRAHEQQAEAKRAVKEQALERRSQNVLRALVAVFALATVISAAFGIFALDQQRLAQANADEAQNIALIAGSQAALAVDDTDTAIALAWQTVQLNPDSARAQAQLSEAAYQPGTVRRFVGHSDFLVAVDISPDESTMLSGAWDGSIFLWNIQTGEILRQFEEHTGAANDVVFSPDGSMALSGSEDGTVIMWNIQTGEVIRQLDDYGERVVAVRFSPDGNSIFGAGWHDGLPLMEWDVETGRVLRRFEADVTGIQRLEITPDGSAIVTPSLDGKIIVWELETGAIINQFDIDLTDTTGALRMIDISPDGAAIMIGFENADMHLYDLFTGELIRRFVIEGGSNTLVFHPTDGSVITTDSTGIMRKIDVATGDELLSLAASGESSQEMALVYGGSHAITAEFDNTLRLWQLQSGHVLRQFAGPSAGAMEADLSPDGRTALSGSFDGTVTLWNVETGEIIRRFVDDQPVMAVTFSPDGQTALIGAGYRFAQKIESGHIILWNVETGEEIRRFEGHPYAVFDVEFSPDGRLAASGGNGALAVLWDVETGQEIRRFEDYWVNSEWPIESYWDVEFSPDGQMLLGAHASGPIVMWDVETGETVGQLEGHSPGARGIAFSNDGLRAVSGALDNQAILWDMQSRTPLRRFTNHVGAIGQVRFSPNEQLMLGGSDDGTNSLWNVETGEEMRRYGNGFVVSPSFSADGRQALVGYQNGAVELWRIDAALDDLLTWTQENRYIPELTCEQRALYRVEPLCESE
jgi:WD40 repeat protein/DNA-binding CsgD family transcriptional regulator